MTDGCQHASAACAAAPWDARRIRLYQRIAITLNAQTDIARIRAQAQVVATTRAARHVSATDSRPVLNSAHDRLALEGRLRLGARRGWSEPDAGDVRPVRPC
jgi:hypothetical protein